MATKLKRLQYSRDDLNTALEHMANGMTIYAASKQFNIPRTTLLYKQRGVYALDAPIGHPTVLTTAEEQKIKEWIVYISQTGFPATKDQLLDSVQLLLKNLRRENNFKDGRPGRRWYEGFLKRNPDISERVSQHLIKSRAIIREQNIRDWFLQINSYLVKNNYMDVITDPKRIFNCDESAFLLAPKEKCVLAAKGEKAVYNLTNNDEKECLTTLIMVNAAGDIPPPIVVYKYKRIPFALGRKMPKGWGMGCSDSGWMTGEVFFEYVANVFLPWLKETDAEFPVILFLDGHVSHLSLPLSEFCKQNQIVLIALYPNATHLLQPLDVGIFRPLKVEWKKAVHEWKMKNEGRRLKNEDFAPLLAKVLPVSANVTTIQNSFKTCGIYPFSADAVNYNKMLKEPRIITSTSNNNVSVRPESFLAKFESFLSEKQLQSFKSTQGKWKGVLSIEDENLYNVWVNINRKFEQQPGYTNFSAIGNANDSIIDAEQPHQELSIPILGEQTLENVDLNASFSYYGANQSWMNIEGVGDVITLTAECSPNLKEIPENLSNNFEAETDQLQKQKQDLLSNVATPYKNSFFWPEIKPSQASINKAKKRIPTVIVSSDEYITYNTKKK